MRERTPLLYTLHSGNLYGTERMALATAWGLHDEFEPVIFTPGGPAAAEARTMGFEVIETTSDRAFATQLRPYLARHKRLAFFSTRTMHSLVFAAMNLFYRRRVVHVQMVHGGTDEFFSYGQKRRLNRLPVTLVAVSEFVRARLLAHGVRDRQIRVIENFLPAGQVAAAPRREPFRQSGIHRVAVVSRLDPIKRIDVLLACLENRPELNAIAFHLYGTGSESEAWKARASKSALNVVFEGFRPDVDEQLAQADLFVHLCPEEPFGLAILEAMAAGVPVVAPDSGGAGSLIEDGVSGLHFAANDAASLGACLAELCQAEPDRLNALVAGARAALATRFSERERLADYRSLIWAGLGERR
jgi:glycosyltransferase involved in cell wall biosynthesis